MKLQHFSRVAVIRAASFCCLALPFLRAWPGGRAFPALSDLVVAVLEADCIFLLVPAAGEDMQLSFCATVFILLFYAVSAFAGMPHWAIIVVTLTAVAAVMWICTYRRHADLGRVFHRMAAWHSVEEAARLNYLSALSVSGTLSVVCLMDGRALWLPLILLVALFALLFARWRTGRTFFVTAARERAVKSHIADTPNADPIPLREDGEDEKKGRLFLRMREMMERDSPFLKPEYDLDGLARDVYTNANYVSRTVNRIYGHGVPHFINSFRVAYAVRLMDENPRLKVSEVSSMSGFGNPVTFNSAFKLEMKMTPKQYLDTVRSRNLNA